MTDYGHWNVSAVGEFDQASWFGFVYSITERATEKCYIGKKQFRMKRKKTLKDKSRTKESDWKTYTSSCEPLNACIDEMGDDMFDFVIHRLCSGKCELSYTEQEYQFRCDILRARLSNGEHKYFNRTISHFNFVGLEKQTTESNRKMLLTFPSV